MKILVTGANGLVGSKFIEDVKNRYQLLTPEYPDFDITNAVLVGEYLKKNTPDVIVHFAAYTNVSEAENQKNDLGSPCWKINVTGTKNIIDSINPAKTHYIHISTDMVFPGDSIDPGPYDEGHVLGTDKARMTWYGFTKAEAEREVGKISGNKATILRLIYPVRAKYEAKLDYLRKPLALFDEGKLYPLFDDQQVSISFIDEISLVLQKIIGGKFYGIFHASCSDTTTPYELISYFIERVRGVKNVAQGVHVPLTPRYPKFGGLKVEQTEKVLDIKYSSWREIVDQISKEIRPSG